MLFSSFKLFFSISITLKAKCFLLALSWCIHIQENAPVSVSPFSSLPLAKSPLSDDYDEITGIPYHCHSPMLFSLQKEQRVVLFAPSKIYES